MPRQGALPVHYMVVEVWWWEQGDDRMQRRLWPLVCSHQTRSYEPKLLSCMPAHMRTHTHALSSTRCLSLRDGVIVDLGACDGGGTKHRFTASPACSLSGH